MSTSVKSLLYSTESYQEIIICIIDKMNLRKDSNIILFTTMIESTKVDPTNMVISDVEKDIRRCESDILKHIDHSLGQKTQSLGGLDSLLEGLNLAIKRYGINKIFEDFNISSQNIVDFINNSLEYLIVIEADHSGSSLEESKEETTPMNYLLGNKVGIELLNFVKLIIGTLVGFEGISTVEIINNLFEYSKIKAEGFNSKMDLLKFNIKEIKKAKNLSLRKHEENTQDLDDPSKTIQELEYEVIECISEVIGNLTLYIHERIDEDVLYSLMNTHLVSIQKATYLSLLHFYQNFTPPLKYKYEEEKELTEEEVKAEFDKHMEELKEAEGDEDQIKLAETRIKGDPDKNVSTILLDIIENPPDFKEDVKGPEEEEKEYESEEEVAHEGFTAIEGASTLLDEKYMSDDVYSYLLAWNSMLNKISSGKMKHKFDRDHEYLRVINSLQEFLEMNRHVYEAFLVVLVAYLPTDGRTKWRINRIIDCKPEWVDLNDQVSVEEFTLFSMYNFMTNFPSLAREYYQD